MFTPSGLNLASTQLSTLGECVFCVLPSPSPFFLFSPLIQIFNFCSPGLLLLLLLRHSTCQDRPGSYMHEAIDVESYCEWGVDYLKIDACRGAGYAAHNTSWIKFRAAIDACTKKRGYPIVMSVESCDDPSDSGCGAWIGKLANLWRTCGDIQAYFGSVMRNAADNTKMASRAGPTGGPLGGGRWNDAGALMLALPWLSTARCMFLFCSCSLPSSPLTSHTYLIFTFLSFRHAASW